MTPGNKDKTRWPQRHVPRALLYALAGCLLAFLATLGATVFRAETGQAAAPARKEKQ